MDTFVIVFIVGLTLLNRLNAYYTRENSKLIENIYEIFDTQQKVNESILNALKRKQNKQDRDDLMY